MDIILRKPPSKDMLDRFPPESYLIFNIPYVMVNAKLKKIKIIPQDQLNSVDADSHLFVVFRKLNWSLKNDLVRESQEYSTDSLEVEFNGKLYFINCIKKLLVVIINEANGHEVWIDESTINVLDKDILDGIMTYFFSHPHFEQMSKDDEWNLRKDIHKYYAYWRKVQSGRTVDAGRARLETPPICPSIIWEVSLAERFGWTFDQIRSLSEKDVKQIQILTTQERIKEFETNTSATFNPRDAAMKHKMDNDKFNKETFIQPTIEGGARLGGGDEINSAASQQEQSSVGNSNMAHNYMRRFKNGG